MYFLLTYDYVDNILEKRQPYRETHLAQAREAAERGELLLGGALANPVDTGVLLFKGDDQSVVEAFVEHDPYVLNGLVTRWQVREWNVVAGALL